MPSVTLRHWRAFSILSAAVTMNAAFAHLMEMPAKRRLERELYVRLHRTLYPMFGRVAGPAEPLAIIGAGGLAWWMRRRRRDGYLPAAVGAGLLAAAHGVFWTVVEPVNRTMASWPLDQIPGDWERWRDQWEYGHAIRACLSTAALTALALSTGDEAERYSGHHGPDDLSEV